MPSARVRCSSPLVVITLRLTQSEKPRDSGSNFLRTLATPEPVKYWSLTSLKEKLIKIGASLVSHGRYVAFEMAEITIPRTPGADILRLIAELRPPPDPAPA